MHCRFAVQTSVHQHPLQNYKSALAAVHVAPHIDYFSRTFVFTFRTGCLLSLTYPMLSTHCRAPTCNQMRNHSYTPHDL